MALTSLVFSKLFKNRNYSKISRPNEAKFLAAPVLFFELYEERMAVAELEFEASDIFGPGEPHRADILTSGPVSRFDFCKIRLVKKDFIWNVC